MRQQSVIVGVFVCAVSLSLPLAFGQVPGGSNPAPSSAEKPPAKSAPLPRFGVAVSVGTLGAGVQVATAVARHTNIRGGGNFFRFSLSGTDNHNGLAYDGTLHLQSGEILVDQNLAGPFHVSAGAMVYDGFQGTGSVHVPGGQSFSLNGATYYSAPSDPVTGTGVIGVRKIAPEFLIGFGNLLPRGRRHFTVNLDLGVAYQGSPNVLLNLAGSTCATPSAGCSSISSNSAVQSNITAEQNKISNTLKPFQFYPVLRLSFGYKR